ncbi:hypothetical protein [Gluconacetobacter dulcium]|uniref:hypothetical protein n=1 Tax=Gluconacetobacter dulcium TaxID=2729096 RepID=UPI0035C825A6
MRYRKDIRRISRWHASLNRTFRGALRRSSGFWGEVALRVSAFALFAIPALFVSTAHAASREEQSAACRGDAIKLCTFAIPNEDKITACMKKKIDQLSPRCRAMFEPAGKKKPRQSKAKSPS